MAAQLLRVTVQTAGIRAGPGDGRWGALADSEMKCVPESEASLVGQLVKDPSKEGDLGSVPGWGRSPGEGRGCPLQDSGLENSRDCTVHGVAEADTTERL